MIMKSDERMEICKRCPLYKEDEVWGASCNSNLYLNPETGETSRFSHVGWIRGCGCHLKYKTKHPNAKCVAGKW